MKKIKFAIRDLKESLAYFGLFSSIFDSLLIFMIFVLVFYLLNLSWLLSFLIVIPYFFIHTRKNIKKMNLIFVEEKCPELKEELRTCADTKNIEDNEIVSMLHEESIKKMKNIKTSYFFNMGKVARQIIFLGIISFLIILSSAYNVKFIDVPKTISDLQDLGKKDYRGPYSIDESLLGYEEMSDDADIFGDKDVAELGRKELKLELNPLLSDVDISKVNDPVSSDNFNAVMPFDIGASTDASYDDSIPKQYQRIVKTYFKEISSNK
jgi:hypothetical protein